MKTKETNTEVKQGAGTYDFSSMLITSEEGEDTSKKPSFEGFEDEEEEEEATPKEGSEDTKEEVEVEETKDKKSLATEEEEEVKKTKEPGEVSHPSKMAKKYIEQGIWEDYIIDYKGEETPISEIEDLDEDTFFEIIKAQKEENEKDISSNYINKSELDEISLEVVEISKKRRGYFKTSLKLKSSS